MLFIQWFDFCSLKPSPPLHLNRPWSPLPSFSAKHLKGQNRQVTSKDISTDLKKEEVRNKCLFRTD